RTISCILDIILNLRLPASALFPYTTLFRSRGAAVATRADDVTGVDLERRDVALPERRSVRRDADGVLLAGFGVLGDHAHHRRRHQQRSDALVVGLVVDAVSHEPSSAPPDRRAASSRTGWASGRPRRRPATRSGHRATGPRRSGGCRRRTAGTASSL